MVSLADRIIDLYERNARNYVSDRRGVGWDESGWLDRFIALLPQHATVLDIGCGSGEPIARYLVERGFALEGVDASPTLISVCRERFPKRCWHVADMRTLGLGRTFHGLLAWDLRNTAHCSKPMGFASMRMSSKTPIAGAIPSGLRRRKDEVLAVAQDLRQTLKYPPECRINRTGAKVVEHRNQ